MKLALKELSIEDGRHLRAAEGWLELGDFVSASDELEEISAQERAHPGVLSLRYAIYSKVGRWEPAYCISSVALQASVAVNGVAAGTAFGFPT